MFQTFQNIIEKYSKAGSLAFEANTMDAQPSPVPNAICIFVTGKVRIDNGNPLHFTHFFQLVSDV